MSAGQFRSTDEEALRLRERARALRSSGCSYRAIGRQMGVSEAMAWRYVNRDSRRAEKMQCLRVNLDALWQSGMSQKAIARRFGYSPAAITHALRCGRLA